MNRHIMQNKGLEKVKRNWIFDRAARILSSFSNCIHFSFKFIMASYTNRRPNGTRIAFQHHHLVWTWTRILFWLVARPVVVYYVTARHWVRLFYIILLGQREICWLCLPSLEGRHENSRAYPF